MTAEPPRLKLVVRLGLSVLIIGQLIAIIAPPLAFQTRGPMGSSPSVGTMLMPVRAYGQMLYVDRGYAFFAPDPGPSHLIQAAITDGSGERAEVMIPDLRRHWPRLRYHRHFMLAEFLTEIHQPPGPPPEMVEVDPEGAGLWRQSRARYEYVRQSIVDHLKHVNRGHDVAIRRIEHLIPSFQDSIELTDPQLYTVLLDRPIIMGAEMELPSGPPETIPAPTPGDNAETIAEEPTDTDSPASPADTESKSSDAVDADGQSPVPESESSQPDADERGAEIDGQGDAGDGEPPDQAEGFS